MSAWAPDPSVSTPAETGTPAPQGRPGDRKIPRWIRVVPFFLSSFLFLSGIFAVFAPFPLLLLGLETATRWFWLACLTNGAIVWVAEGATGLAFYAVFSLVLALSLSWLLKHKFSLERAAAGTLAAMALTAILIFGWHSHIHHVKLIDDMKTEIKGWVEIVAQSMVAENQGDPDEWKQGLLSELPSGVAIFSLVLVWINLVLLVRFKHSEHLQLRRWKAPEILLWPTLASAALMLFAQGKVALWSLVAFKVFMAVYAIQGLAILSFFFDAWNIRGLFRSLGYMLAVFLMMPLLLGVGFFDLWFDFRAKLRQS